MTAPSERVLLIILDGFGEGKDYDGNAITRAHAPTIARLKQTYPWTTLKSHGNAVGLPENIQGGSEVGHFTIGAGRVVFQSLETINRSIAAGDFFTKPALIEACTRINGGAQASSSNGANAGAGATNTETNRGANDVTLATKSAAPTNNNSAALHLIGMISDQGVHSHIEHLFALLKLAKDRGIATTYIHAITDGRDVPERSAEKYIRMLQEKITELGMNAGSPTQAIIATIIGRYFAMDRDKNFDRTRRAYDLYTVGTGTPETDPIQAIQNAYARGIATDYYIDPIVLDEHATIHDKDSVIFWNYRTDRTRQLTGAFTGEESAIFAASQTTPVHPYFVCMGDYSKIAPVLFPTPVITNNLGSIIAQNNLSQLRIAETEKYAHVTYFFNSQVEQPFDKETRILIDSPKCASYAEKPEMSARNVTDHLLAELERTEREQNAYALTVLNFANTDLVGHSGNFAATKQAVEVIDECLARITDYALTHGYHTIITGDHGNAEYMIYDDGPNKGEPCPSHTKNPVPFILVSDKYKNAHLAPINAQTHSELQDIAPTILAMLHIKQPPEMTGTNLLAQNNAQ